MKGEIYFDDLMESYQSKAKNTTGDQIRIPQPCFSCDGSDWSARGCLKMDCPIYNFFIFETQNER